MIGLGIWIEHEGCEERRELVSWEMKQGMEGLKRPKKRYHESYWTNTLEKADLGQKVVIIELAVLGCSIYGARYDYGSTLLSWREQKLTENVINDLTSER